MLLNSVRRRCFWELGKSGVSSSALSMHEGRLIKPPIICETNTVLVTTALQYSRGVLKIGKHNPCLYKELYGVGENSFSVFRDPSGYSTLGVEVSSADVA